MLLIIIYVNYHYCSALSFGHFCQRLLVNCYPPDFFFLRKQDTTIIRTSFALASFFYWFLFLVASFFYFLVLILILLLFVFFMSFQVSYSPMNQSLSCTIAKFGETKSSVLKYVWYTEEVIHVGHISEKYFR